MNRPVILLVVLMALTSDSGYAVDSNWQPSTRAEEWDIRYSPGMPHHPLQDGSGWRFSFPRYDGALPCLDLGCPSVGYVTTSALGPLNGKSVTISVEITSSASFQYRLEPDNTCSQLATLRLFIERRDDDLEQEFYRWWSNLNSILLVPGKYTMTVPLTPDRWSSVLGKNGIVASEEFYAALEDAENIGMTFGGGCFYGHGVNVSGGQATFALKKLVISR